jgi:hypothetical protein
MGTGIRKEKNMVIKNNMTARDTRMSEKYVFAKNVQSAGRRDAGILSSVALQRMEVCLKRSLK